LDGDVWYNTSTGKLRCREGGVSRDCSPAPGLADPGANGIVSRTASGATTVRMLQGATGKISITNGDGVSANPVIGLGSDVVDRTQRSTYTAGMKQTFSPNATSAGINVGATTGDPSAVLDGDVWYNNTLGKIRCRENGSTKDCTSAGSGGTTSFLLGGQLNAQIGSGATNYSGPFGGALSGAETIRAQSLSGPGTVSNLYILTSSAQPAGCDLHVYLNVGGVTSPMDVAILGGSAAGSYIDTTHSAVFSDQQKVSIKFVNGACSSANIISWVFKVTN
jgi:hypothetical protein